VSDAGGERRQRRWETPAAVMVAFKTAGVLDGAQVERRVAPLEPRAVAAGLRTRGWQGRRGARAGGRKHRIHGWCWITHDTMLARVQGGLESKVERRAAPQEGGGAFARAVSGGERGGRVWGVWATRSCSGAASLDARPKLLS